jgi:hypothetical protein
VNVGIYPLYTRLVLVYFEVICFIIHNSYAKFAIKRQEHVRELAKNDPVQTVTFHDY